MTSIVRIKRNGEWLILGKIRVGRRVYKKNGTYTDPEVKGYLPIICMTASSKYGSLSPYELKVNGMIIENIWQFSKVYERVPKTVQYRSRYDKTVIWEHPAETHIDRKGELTELYWKWREKGMKAEDPIRYPVGYDKRSLCKYSIKSREKKRQLTYITARKEIYVPLYLEAVKGEGQFKDLTNLLESGKNLLIIEVDGPHYESMDYYKKTYNISEDFIDSQNTVEITEENMKILLNDPKHPFGHGYCLGIALLDLNI